MADNFDKWDQQELQKDRTDAKKEKDDRKQFKSALKNRRNGIRKRVKEEEGIGTKSRQRERFKTPLTNAETKDRKRYQTNVLPGDLEEEVARRHAQLLSIGALIWYYRTKPFYIRYNLYFSTNNCRYLLVVIAELLKIKYKIICTYICMNDCGLWLNE